MSRSPSPRLRPALLAAAWLAALPLLAAATEAPAESHCTADEQTLFACSTGRKLLSVCASAQPTRDAGSVQYRFGAPGRSPFVLPAAAADWRIAVRGGSLMYSGGGGAYLTFANPPYRYVVYSAIGRDWGSRAGVVVEKYGRRIANLPCVGAAASALGPDLFERAGIVEDPLGFELP